MSGTRAGVVCVSKFVTPQSKKFKNYVNYIDREAAVRNDNYKEYNAFTQPDFHDYHEYMENPEKSTGLFTRDKDTLTKEDKQQLKQCFDTAQAKESVMWQTVFSFDMDFLAKTGLYNPVTQEIEEQLLKQYIRKSMDSLLKTEGLQHSTVWSASFHYNTEHIHCHVAMVEPKPTRPFMEYNGKTVRRGKLKLSSIERAKSQLVNQILVQSEPNIQITQIKRETILQRKKTRNVLEDNKLRKMVEELYELLPQERGKWQYNRKEIEPLKEKIDKISKEYLKTYHKEELEELERLLRKQQAVYREAYGKLPPNKEQDFAENKMRDLYARLGNAILKDLQQFDKELLQEHYRHQGQKGSRGQTRQTHTQQEQRRQAPQSEAEQRATASVASTVSTTLSQQRSGKSYRHFGRSLDRLLFALKRDLNDNFRHWKNQLEYERMEQAIDYGITVEELER